MCKQMKLITLDLAIHPTSPQIKGISTLASTFLPASNNRGCPMSHEMAAWDIPCFWSQIDF